MLVRLRAPSKHKAAKGGLFRAGILRQNYRSHASLLSIPNRLFYGDQLQAAADQDALRPPQWAPLQPVTPPLDEAGRAGNEDGRALR